MTVRPIVKWPDPRLSEVCAPVENLTMLADLVRDMFETMYDAPGRGLAAPQIGVMQRVFVMDPTWKDGDRSPFVCINPEIHAAGDDTAQATEACLSIPGVWHETRLTGFAATCAQHELDHLNGVVIFDRLAPQMRAQVEARYAALA